jgi:hypothetical protein
VRVISWKPAIGSSLAFMQVHYLVYAVSAMVAPEDEPPRRIAWCAGWVTARYFASPWPRSATRRAPLQHENGWDWGASASPQLQTPNSANLGLFPAIPSLHIYELWLTPVEIGAVMITLSCSKVSS